jgi:hypothetical protein
MPVAREDAGSAVINGQVWIVGGLTNPGHQLVAQIDVYDPDLDAWVQSLAIKPHDADWPGRALGDFACAVGDTLWCLAGTETTENYPFLQPPRPWDSSPPKPMWHTFPSRTRAATRSWR